MKITVSNHILLSNVPPDLRRELAEKLTFSNPKWLENERMGRWNGETPQYLRCYEEYDGALIIPRGFARQVVALLRRHGVPYDVDDQRRSLPEVDFGLKGKLKPFQEEAVQATLKRHSGTLSSPTGSGKTVMALAIVAERRQPALIVVHTRELLNQWVDLPGLKSKGDVSDFIAGCDGEQVVIERALAKIIKPSRVGIGLRDWCQG